MPLQTDLSVSPYFDDFNENKDYYKILFQPGVAVQARELNQLQTILQNQIEKFGDNILKKGTIVDGCNIEFYPRLPYVKIRDTETTGAPVNVSQYLGLYLRNSANLQAIIVKTEPGLEASSPDLNTLFIQYQNSGDDFNTSQYSESEVLTVFDTKNPVFKYVINDGSSGFANSDQVVVTSAIAIQNSTGGTTIPGLTVEVNDYIRNAGVATAQIVEVNSTARSDALVLRIKPVPTNLTSSNNALWTFYEGDSVEIYKFATPTIKSTANKIEKIYGFGAAGSLITDSLGKVVSIAVTNSGQNYDFEPFVSISSNSAVVTEIEQFSATAQRYLTNITVAPATYNPIGFGYGMSVTNGVIYQKGYFSRVAPQLIVVNKYSNTGFDKSVGFTSNEEIINSNIDTSLLDNAFGSPNYTAPGADRLRITPTLSVLSKADADANTEFFTIVDFADGQPYKQSQQTVYSTIGDMIAGRTYEESGNYVLDKFYLSTKDTANVALTSNSFNIVVDPGQAYIKGYKVKTFANFVTNVPKGIDTLQKNEAKIVLDYGNYMVVNELGGTFNFVAGDIVELYSGTLPTYSATFTDSGDLVTVASHGLVAGDQVYFTAITSTTGITTATKYFVINTTTNTFQLASVAGGTAITLTTNGSGTMVKAADNTVGARYISNTPGSTITAPGTKIGQARIRSLIYQEGSGPVGTPDATFRMYLFDIVMTSGKAASDIRSIYYPGQTVRGIADVILENGKAVINEAKGSGMLFKAVNATKSLSNTIFTYKASLATSISQQGEAIISPGVGESFPYTFGTLTESEQATITVTPTVDFQRQANITGTVTTSPSTNIVTGSGTNFTTQLNEGDFIKIDDNSNASVAQIIRITNATSLTLASNVAFSFSGANAVQYFPKYVAIPLTLGADRTANTGSGNLIIDIGANISLASANVIIDYNVTREHELKAKVPVRNAYARILTSNNDTTNAGPWPLGVADVFRLRAVYSANSANQISTFAGTAADINTDFITIPNHPFSDRDLVTYTCFAGNTAITPLSNNGSYYVFAANSSGFKLKTSYSAALPLDLTVTGAGVGHQFEGRPIFITPTTNGVENVTNQFYIDNGHNADYLDISYLYRKARTTVDANTTLLVQFDAFETTGEGVKTISSYTIDDIHSLANIDGNSVHTLEIPELFSNYDGRYIDVRDQIDIRPVSTATIPLINTTAAFTNTAIINPKEPVDGVFANVSFNANTSVSNTADFITITSNPFVDGDAVVYTVAAGNTAVSPLTNAATYYVVSSNSTGVKLSTSQGGSSLDLTAGKTETGHNLKKSMLRFSEAAKFFPIPGTTSISNVEYYVGRTDRVVLTTDGRFRVIKGVPGNQDSIPAEPADSMTINIVKVPPYPSLPRALSAEMAAIADTKVFNEKPNLRKDNFRINTLLDDAAVSMIQIKPYRMADIATLEKRIQNLEYYVTYTLAETIAKSRYIGSSSNPAIDRFKFGFFVDSFTNYAFSDVTSPEYKATISNDMLLPKIDEFNIEFTFDTNSDGIIGESLASFEYDEYTLINQNNATAESGTVQAVTEDVTVVTVTQEISTAIGQYRSSARNINKTVYEDWQYTLSSLPGPVRLFMNARDNRVQIEVYQGTSPGDTSGNPIATSLAWQPLTNADKAPGGGAFNVGGKHENGTFSTYPWVEDSFKLIWDHDPSRGQYYTIRVFKGGRSGGLFPDAPKGFYTFKIYYPVDKITTETKTVPVASRFEYNGSVFGLTPQTFTLSQGYTSIDLGFYGGGLTVPLGYIADAQKFDISITGLRPLTRHYFYFDEVDVTSKCRQVRTTATAGTDGLVTDANGVLVFSFYYDAGIDEAAESDFTRQNQLAAQIAGIKTFSVQNIDATSRAQGTIDLKYYADSINYNVIPSLTPISTGSSTGSTSTQDTISTSTTTTVTPTTDYNYTLSGSSGGSDTSVSGGGGLRTDYVFENNVKAY